MVDTPVALEVDECADRILDRYPVIDRMLLVELDAFEPPPSQAVCTSAAQMIGSTISDPTVGTGSPKTTLCGDHQLCWVRMERLGDQRLADPGAIRVGGIDKGDALIHYTPEQRDRLALIAGGTPHPLSGDAHRTKPDMSDRQLSRGDFC